MQITANFNSIHDRMACPCCNGFMYDKTFMKRIQILRDVVDTPFVLDRRGGGFYRCTLYQKSINPSVVKSQHCLGKAMDIYSLGWAPSLKWYFVQEAMRLGMSVGVYKTFFHVDYRSGNPVLFYGEA